MIPKSRKFPMRSEFIVFRSRARQHITSHARIYHLKSNISSRLAVVVPKKVSKLATTRNWIKRLTYSTLWTLVRDLNLDIVVIYKPLPLKKSLTTKQQIITEIESLVLEN